MNSDLVLKRILSLFLPFYLLTSFIYLVNYNLFGFYSFIIALLYILLVYLFLKLIYKNIDSNELFLFKFFGRFLVLLFLILLILISIIILNIKVQSIYDYIKF